MLEIKLEHLDELHMLSVDLEVISYLQALIQYDSNNTIIFEDGLEFACKNAESYLWQKQFETVIKLKNLLEREDFACGNKTQEKQ